MKKWDERARIKEAIRSWVANYGVDGSYAADRRGRAVGRELLALDAEAATGYQVNEIIGNESWAGPLSCSQCRARTYDIVEIGEPQDYESATAYLCMSCLRAAINLLDSVNQC